MENNNSTPTQHMEVKVPSAENNNQPKVEKVYFTKKQIFFRNWAYAFLGFGILTFFMNFIVLFMIPSVSSKFEVWMGFYQFKFGEQYSMSGAGGCCIAFNVIWMIGMIVQLIGMRLNGVKLFAPYVKKYSIILLLTSWFIMILGLTASPMSQSSSSWMFNCNFGWDPLTIEGYSFTGGGLVILFEGIIFILVMVTKIIWFHVPNENKEWFLNTKIVKRMTPTKKSDKE